MVHTCTTDHFESTTLTSVKTPWWWHPWNVETCKRIFCYLLWIYSSAYKVGFMRWFLHYGGTGDIKLALVRTQLRRKLAKTNTRFRFSDSIQNECKINTQWVFHCFSAGRLRRTALHAGWSTTTPFRKLGVENERNGFRQVPMALHVISFREDGLNRNSTDQNQEYLMRWSNKFQTLLPLFPWLLKEKFWVCVLQVAEVTGSKQVP